MNQLQRLEEGIRRAAQAGDGDAVRALGAELQRMQQSAQNMDFGPPPEGAIIHGAEGSTVAGQNIGVDTRGMSMQERDVASRALAARGATNDSMGRAAPLFQGLSLSGGDEVVSGAYGALGALRGRDFGNEYDFAQEFQRQELDQARTDRPIESMATQVLGNVGTGVAMGGAGLLPSLAGRSLAGQATIGAGVGGTLGAVDGALSGSGAEDRATKAGTGAAIGTLAGAAVPLVISGAKAGVQRLADSATVDRALSRLGISRPAADQIKRTLDADAPTAARNLRQAGPDAMLADSGPRLTRHARYRDPEKRGCRKPDHRRCQSARRQLTEERDAEA
jgi:hypothetical protein